MSKIKPLTLQEVFNNAWNAFVVEKSPPSVRNKETNCLYRGPNGLKCAIGVSIPDEIYIERMDTREDSTISSLIENFTSIRQLFEKIDTNPLQELQTIHDGYGTFPRESHEQFTRKITKDFRRYAKKYKLIVPKIIRAKKKA